MPCGMKGLVASLSIQVIKSVSINYLCTTNVFFLTTKKCKVLHRYLHERLLHERLQRFPLTGRRGKDAALPTAPNHLSADQWPSARTRDAAWATGEFSCPTTLPDWLPRSARRGAAMGDYVTMKDLGSELGLTSHQVGQKLKDLGLAHRCGPTSELAFDCGFVAQKWTTDGRNYLWAWHRGLTLKTLATLGVKPKTPDPPQ